MPATRRHPSSTNPRVSGRFLAADTTTWHLATVPQLRAQNLRLHLSARNLATTGNKTVMAQRLYADIHSTGSSVAAIVSPPPTITTTTTTTTQSTPLPLAGSDSPHLNTTTAMAPTTTTTANNAQVVPHSSNSQLQPHHLANLLCQAALQLSGNLSHVLPQLQLPTEALVPPATTVTATAQATTSNQPHLPQQEDQLSEASALIPTIPSPGTPLPTTITRNPPPLDTTLDPTSSLPPCPSSTA